jgi:hypothetical protein
MFDLLFLANIFGALAFIVSIWRLQLKEFKSIIWAEIPHAGLWAVYYTIIATPSGLIISLISIFRSTARLYLPERHIKQSLIFLTILIWILCVYFATGWHSILPAIASTVVSYGMLFDDRRKLTNCTLIHYGFWIVYGFIIASPYLVASITICTISCIIGKYRHEKRRSTDLQETTKIIKQPV